MSTDNATTKLDGGESVSTAGLGLHPGGCPTCKDKECEARDNADTSLCNSHTALASAFMDAYYPGWYCSHRRCGHYRMKDSDGDAWCWLRHGIGAEGREKECPAYQLEMRHTTNRPNAELSGGESGRSPLEAVALERRVGRR